MKAMYVKEDTKIETIVYLLLRSIFAYVLTKEFEYRIPVTIYCGYKNYYHFSGFQLASYSHQLSIKKVRFIPN